MVKGISLTLEKARKDLSDKHRLERLKIAHDNLYFFHMKPVNKIVFQSGMGDDLVVPDKYKSILINEMMLAFQKEIEDLVLKDSSTENKVTEE
jgi:hypothetical protein